VALLGVSEAFKVC